MKHVQRNLAVMFTDISGFTRHSETISREALMERLETHNNLLMPVVAHFEGQIVKTIGDALMITFESPTNAVQCGLFMQHTLKGYNQDRNKDDQIHIKIAINSGEVTVTEDDVFGDAVNIAAKIEKATNPDETYFTEPVFLAMKRVEVPSAFVKHFRPRGEDSEEIKLYKVVQDESDELYLRIVSQTTIDPRQVQSRSAELSRRATGEIGQYLEKLVEALDRQQSASRKNITIGAAALLLMIALLVVGSIVFRNISRSQQEIRKRTEVIETLLRYKLEPAAWSVNNNKVMTEIKEARHMVGDDPDMLWKLGMALKDVSFETSRFPSAGILEIQKSIAMGIPLTPEKKEQLAQAFLWWLVNENSSAGMVRDMLKETMYSEMKDDLEERLSDKNVDIRMNSAAILMDMGDTMMIGDGNSFFQKHFKNFITDGQMLSREHWRSLFKMDMDADSYREHRTIIESTTKSVKAGKGILSAYRDAPTILSLMLSDLKELQPGHTAGYQP
jgi:class 3 adenylate cyclase